MPSVGETRVLKNGAEGVYKLNANGKLVFRITKGVSNPGYLRSIAKDVKRGQKPLSLKQAERVFKKFYSPKKYKSPRAAKAAATRDMCHLAKRVTTTSNYTRSPKRFDYQGLDDGSRCKGKMIASPPASRIAKARAALSTSRFRPNAQELMNIQLGGGCGWNENTARCNKVKGPEMNAHCVLGGKSGDRCVKTKVAPKGNRAMTAMLKGYNIDF